MQIGKLCEVVSARKFLIQPSQPQEVQTLQTPVEMKL